MSSKAKSGKQETDETGVVEIEAQAPVAKPKSKAKAKPAAPAEEEDHNFIVVGPSGENQPEPEDIVEGNEALENFFDNGDVTDLSDEAEEPASEINDAIDPSSGAGTTYAGGEDVEDESDAEVEHIGFYHEPDDADSDEPDEVEEPAEYQIEVLDPVTPAEAEPANREDLVGYLTQHYDFESLFDQSYDELIRKRDDLTAMQLTIAERESERLSEAKIRAIPDNVLIVPESTAAPLNLPQEVLAKLTEDELSKLQFNNSIEGKVKVAFAQANLIGSAILDTARSIIGDTFNGKPLPVKATANDLIRILMFMRIRTEHLTSRVAVSEANEGRLQTENRNLREDLKKTRAAHSDSEKARTIAVRRIGDLGDGHFERAKQFVIRSTETGAYLACGRKLKNGYRFFFTLHLNPDIRKAEWFDDIEEARELMEWMLERRFGRKVDPNTLYISEIVFVNRGS